jgi:hypothetical protein
LAAAEDAFVPVQFPSVLFALSLEAIHLHKHNKSQNKHHSSQHHDGTITHIVLDLLHQLELFYRKQQTRRRNEMRVKE